MKDMYLIKFQVYPRNSEKNVSYPIQKCPNWDRPEIKIPRPNPTRNYSLKCSPTPDRFRSGPGNSGFRVAPQVLIHDKSGCEAKVVNCVHYDVRFNVQMLKCMYKMSIIVQVKTWGHLGARCYCFPEDLYWKEGEISSVQIKWLSGRPDARNCRRTTWTL